MPALDAAFLSCSACILSANPCASLELDIDPTIETFLASPLLARRAVRLVGASLSLLLLLEALLLPWLPSFLALTFFFGESFLAIRSTLDMLDMLFAASAGRFLNLRRED